MAEKTAPDWELIERDYRAGILSVREIAAAHNVSHPAVLKRAKRDGWDRDLAPRIQARAEALVTKQAVTAEVTAARQVTEREIIEANAARIAQVRGEHRSDINRVRSLGLTLLSELEVQSANVEVLQSLGEIMKDPDEYGRDKLNDLYRKVIDTPSRVDSAKKVAETLKHAIAMEREAYGLDEDKPDPAKDAAISTMTPNEIARRIAFALALGLQQKEQGK